VRFCSIGSGSKGNGTLVQHDETIVLIDDGFSLKDMEFRLAQKGLTPLQITAILVTHEHGDHIKGVGPLARKFRIPVYVSHGTAQHEGLGKIPSLKIIDSHESFMIGSLKITPVVVPHDAREPTQFVISSGEFKFGILTDLGSFTPHIISQYQSCHGLMLETNHDEKMLSYGPYPPKLKVRVAGNLGHLNNVQAGEFLKHVDCEKLQHVVATHISGQNNSVELAVDSICRSLNCETDFVVVADQATGFDWLEMK